MIPRYNRPKIERIWSRSNKFKIWTEIECLIAEQLAKLKVIPLKAANKISELAVRNKAIQLVDKAGKYKDPDASIGLKTNIEKKADLKVQKMGNKWK